MKITVEAVVRSDIESVWSAWNNPEDIKQWNFASADWQTTASTVDLREGGSFSSRMEAKDGSAGFDFSGTYTKVRPRQQIEYALDDGRTVTITFSDAPGGIRITETFDADRQMPPEQQRQGWQSILDNFRKHVENG